MSKKELERKIAQRYINGLWHKADDLPEFYGVDMLVADYRRTHSQITLERYDPDMEKWFKNHPTAMWCSVYDVLPNEEDKRMARMNEFKVGDKHLIPKNNGDYYKVEVQEVAEFLVRPLRCEGCFFQNYIYCLNINEVYGPCGKESRSDHKNVIFKEITD